MIRAGKKNKEKCKSKKEKSQSEDWQSKKKRVKTRINDAKRQNDIQKEKQKE